MHFTVYMEDPAERAALFRMLEIWRDLTCSCVEFSSWDPEERPEPGGILFWDLDGRLPPASIDGAYALFLCSSSSSAAIASYSLHPAGFLRKPIGMEKLWAALHRCIKLWWDSLERLEILSDRLRVRLPLCDLIWAEGARRGCLVHSSQECIVNCETLSSLEARLPKGLFFRCQRSFLINLTHVRQLDSQGLLMSDGTLIPMNRGSRKPISDAYRQLRLRMEGDPAASPPFGKGCDGL